MHVEKSDSDSDRAAEPDGAGARVGIKDWVKSGAVVPAIVIAAIAVAVISMLGLLVSRAVGNGGLMPRPTALDTYACQGFSAPFQMVFRHGMDVVQLRTPTVTVYGDLLNGKIQWEGLSNAIAQLGFEPPSEIVYDDTRSLRVIDAEQSTRTERLCTRQP